MLTATPASARALPRIDSLNETLTGQVLLAVCASAFVAVCAHVSFPLPFTPVPLTFSDFAVILLGLALGPRTAFAALVLYLAEGASGLPVFSPTGPGGIAQLLGPTGGFLLAYPAAAALAGYLRKAFSSFSSRYLASLVAAAAGSALLMIAGLVWFGFLLHLSPRTAFLHATAPFLPGQVIKVLSAAGIYTTLARWRQR